MEVYQIAKSLLDSGYDLETSFLMACQAVPGRAQSVYNTAYAMLSAATVHSPTTPDT